MSFTAINDGSYFEEQLRAGENEKHLDIFAVYGLHADGPTLDHRTLRTHYRMTVMPHVFQTTTAMGKTRGPKVPTWTHVNIARDKFNKLDQDSLRDLQTTWSSKSRQTWNPFEVVGSVEALTPLVGTKGARVLPDKYYVHLEDAEDEQAGSACPNPAAGTSSNPFDVDDDEPPTSSPSGTPTSPFNVDDPPPSTSSHYAGSNPSTPRTDRANPAPTHPASSSRQRVKPKGVLLGTWKRAGLHADNQASTSRNSQLANAVFGSRDKLNRINRRVAKVDVTGQVVLGGAYDVRKTACSHEDIDYVSTFQGMTKQEVDAHIQPLLDALEARDSDQDHTARAKREGSPTNAAAARHAARAEAARSAAGSGSVAGGFQVRGARFFVSQDNVVFES